MIAISLQEFLKELLVSVNVTGKVQVHFTGEDLDGLNADEEFHLCVYRIVQEQLNNVLRYGNAAEVFVCLKRTGSQLLLSVLDDGKGFNTTVRHSGIGLVNMKTRAESIGGTLLIESSPGKG